MDELTYAALDQMLGVGLTNNPLDNKRAVMALRSVYDPQRSITDNFKDHMIVKNMILRKRANYREWKTQVQRDWQTNRRSVTPRSCIVRYKRWGERHDLATLIRADEELITAREKYVRCDDKDHSARLIETTWQ